MVRNVRSFFESTGLSHSPCSQWNACCEHRTVISSADLRSALPQPAMIKVHTLITQGIVLRQLIDEKEPQGRLHRCHPNRCCRLSLVCQETLSALCSAGVDGVVFISIDERLELQLGEFLGPRSIYAAAIDRTRCLSVRDQRFWDKSVNLKKTDTYLCVC